MAIGTQIRIFYNASYRMPAVIRVDDPQLTVEVADYLQDYVLEGGERYHVWPMCQDHGYGLHPRLHEGRPRWWCSRGHSVAEIGALGAD